MGTTAPKYIKQVQDAGETMNREAVEYVRGIPVVKVFQQTIYSFKSFYRSILKLQRKHYSLCSCLRVAHEYFFIRWSMRLSYF